MSRSLHLAAKLVAVALVLAAVIAVPAAAQAPATEASPRAQIAPAWDSVSPPAEPPSQSQPSQAYVPPASRPGLIDAVSGFVKDQVKDAQKSIESLNERVGEVNRNNTQAARDAVQGLGARLPGSHVVTGRAVCTLAANGSPDCTEGSNKLCRDKGYGDGRSLATETAQNCPARVLISGRTPRPGECRMDTFVTQAICQ